MKHLLRICLLALMSHSLLGQDNNQSARSLTEVNPLDTLYDGGSEAFGTLLRQTLLTPRSLLGSKNGGFVIFEISVQSTGEVSAKMMTKFSEDTEKSVIKSIQATVSGWIVHPTDYKVYQPVLFNLFIEDQASVSRGLNMFPEKFEYPILPLVTVTHMGITRSVRRVSSSAQGSQATEIPESLANKVGQKTSSGTLDVMVAEVNKLKDRLVMNLEKGKAKRAYKIVSEILALNPFNKALIQQRRRLEKELGKDEYRVYDILWLQAMNNMGLN